jgi:hypothetical protein
MHPRPARAQARERFSLAWATSCWNSSMPMKASEYGMKILRYASLVLNMNLFPNMTFPALKNLSHSRVCGTGDGARDRTHVL